jgi:hypothetical protein
LLAIIVEGANVAESPGLKRHVGGKVAACAHDPVAVTVTAPERGSSQPQGVGTTSGVDERQAANTKPVAPITAGRRVKARRE